MAFVRLQRPPVKVAVIGNMHDPQTPIRFCIHSTESHDRPGTSDIAGVLTYLKNTPDELGVQFCIDGEGNLGQGGYANRVMYGAAGANTGTIHCELIGQASFIRARWVFRTKQRETLARLMAWCHAEYGIPLKWSVTHGFFTHRQATNYYLHGVGHWDPGFGFPTWLVMRRAQRIVKAGGWYT